ncbi:putative phage related protein [Escherichia coli]|uniref:Putative phage related protein n=1 Tax=Escherichia coli TaxID=562 RepID=A0A377HFS9_ECOLX|nr:putative phage related protein [Escherichia coli]
MYCRSPVAARRISGINTSATQLRSDDGSTYFELNPDTRKIKIVAPVVLDVVAPLADFSEKVTIHGLFNLDGGMWVCGFWCGFKNHWCC